MLSFLGTWLATAIASAVAVWLVPGLVPMGDELTSIAIFSLAIALINASIRPIMRVLSLPLTIITLGFFHLVVNAAALLIASWLTVNILHAGVYIVGFWDAFWGAIIISIVGAIVSSIIGIKD